MENIANSWNDFGCTFCNMKKIEPENKVYPVWALFIVILFALVVIFCG